MTLNDAINLVIVTGLLAYLIYALIFALIFPGRF